MDVPCNTESNSQSLYEWLEKFPGPTFREKCIQGQEEIFCRMTAAGRRSEKQSGYRQVLCYIREFLCMEQKPFIGDLLESEPQRVAAAA